MSYFTAVIARSGPRWRALDVAVEDVESLGELADELRAVANGGPVLAVLEREDQWFALVRVDAESDARVFVSDLEACGRSRYAEVLAPAGDVDVEDYAHLLGHGPVADRTADDGWGEDDTDEDEATVSAGADDDDPEVDEDWDDDLEEIVAVDDPTPAPLWAGDPTLLDDLGVPPHELVDVAVEEASDPASALAGLGERCGFDELLEALR